MSLTATTTARRIALIYTACAALWIFTSDRLLHMLFSDPELLTYAQSLKGWGFMALTAVLLFWLLQRELKTRTRLAADERTARTEAEVAQLRLAGMLEHIPDGFVALDNAWRYTYLNEKAAQLLGRRREDLLGKHIWTEFPEDIGQPSITLVTRCRTSSTPAVHRGILSALGTLVREPHLSRCRRPVDFFPGGDGAQAG